MSERVSLILPNYCPDEEVRSRMLLFLHSLTTCTDPGGYQFIVIENGSESRELRDVADFYAYKPQPIGFARAVNLGVALADHDLLVIANNDIVLSPNWLPQLIADYKEFGPGILSPLDFKGAPGVHRDKSWWSLVITDRKTWATVGYLDESLPFRFHDQDWNIRAKKAGFNVMRTGNVVVGHTESSTYSKMSLDKEEDAERDLMIARHGAAHFVDWLQLQ